MKGSNTRKNVRALLAKGTKEALVELVQHIQSVRSKKRVAISIWNELNDFLLDNNVTGRIPSYVVGSSHGLAVYIASMLQFLIGSEDQQDEKQWYDFLLNELAILQQPESSPLLDEASIEELLELADQIGALDRVATNKFGIAMTLIYIPYLRPGMNAAFQADFNLILLYCTDLKKAGAPEYVFMHEQGHALQVSITGEISEIPTSFAPVSRQLFNPVSDEVKPEIFADCFAVAAMTSSSFAAKNPLCGVFKPEHQQLLRDYFVTICNEPGTS